MNNVVIIPNELLDHKSKTIHVLYARLCQISQNSEGNTFVIPGARKMARLCRVNEETYLRDLHELAKTQYLKLFDQGKGRGFFCILNVPDFGINFKPSQGRLDVGMSRPATLHNIQSSRQVLDIHSDEGESRPVKLATIARLKREGASEEHIQITINLFRSYKTTMSRSGYTSIDKPDGLFVNICKEVMQGRYGMKSVSNKTREAREVYHIYPTEGWSSIKIDYVCHALNERKVLSGDDIPSIIHTVQTDSILQEYGKDEIHTLYYLDDRVVLIKVSPGKWRVHWDTPENVKSLRSKELERMSLPKDTKRSGVPTETFSRSIAFVE